MSDFITVAELRIEAERLCDENERLEAENAKLRNDADLLRAMLSQVQTEKRCYMAENVKLRELCAGLLTGYECGYVELCKGCTWDGLGDSKTFSCLPRAKARDLGVEVDA